MLRVPDFTLEDLRFEFRVGHLKGSANMSFSWFPVVCLSQSHRARNLSELLQGPVSSHRASLHTVAVQKRIPLNIPLHKGSEQETIFQIEECFRVPSLSTYRFCVDWKQSKHVPKKHFLKIEKLFFCKA